VVLHGGPTAVFRTGSLPESGRLAAAIAEVPGLDGTRVALTLTSSQVGVRLTRELWFIESHHLDLARAISAIAREHGATADRSLVQEVQLAIAAKPDEIDLPFWRTVLGYQPLAEDNGLDPLGHGSTVWMQDLDPDRALRHAMHVDVSVAREQARSRVEAAVAAGGRIVDQSPNHWTLADRAGNKVDVTAWPDGYPDPAHAEP
jgi:4a-hydroxytetrahydrobiopterin dehydratase